MEKLKSMVPSTLKRMISESTQDDLPSTSSSLIDFFLPLQQFQDVVRDLTDPKTALFGKHKDAALDSKHKGNECFSIGDYAKALSFYSQEQALRFAPMGADDVDANLVATLYVNRACSLHLGNIEKLCKKRNTFSFPLSARVGLLSGMGQTRKTIADPLIEKFPVVSKSLQRLRRKRQRYWERVHSRSKEDYPLEENQAPVRLPYPEKTPLSSRGLSLFSDSLYQTSSREQHRLQKRKVLILE
ncbi:hypothetical protein HHK36_018710 [Tetracentron sinense]|uniref:Uncharacterized protein n=1 Tax=Tetracentron sinense TaxID=13715 RepID=A0A834Z4W0_TETSI|nr:hypothetical protein HHK36_018710 [Tetracentron sinense]